IRGRRARGIASTPTGGSPPHGAPTAAFVLERASQWLPGRSPAGRPASARASSGPHPQSRRARASRSWAASRQQEHDRGWEEARFGIAISGSHASAFDLDLLRQSFEFCLQRLAVALERVEVRDFRIVQGELELHAAEPLANRALELA